MAYTQVDFVFIEAFREQFIAHLKKELVPGVENQAKKMVDDAINGKSLGKLTRIFDALSLPVIDQQKFFQNLEEAGSMDAYMRPILKEAASVLLNEDKSALHEEVIRAIGIDKYAQLIGGLIQGEVKEGIDNRTVNASKEKAIEVAQLVLSSVIVNYSQSIETYNLTKEEKLCRDQLNELFDEIKELEKTIETATEVSIHKTPQTMKINNLNELFLMTNRAILACKEKVENEGSSLDDLLQQLAVAKAIYDSGTSMINGQIKEFSGRVTIPLQQIATTFTLQTLEPVSKSSLEEVQRKTQTFLEIAWHAQEELAAYTDKYRAENHEAPLPEDLQTANTVIRNLIDRLQTARDVAEVMEGHPEDTLRDAMLTKYNEAVNHFVENVKEDFIKVKPPKELLNIILRCLRAIFIGSLITKEEKADQERFKQESTFKDDLLALKNKLPKPSIADNKPDTGKEEPEEEPEKRVSSL